MLIYIISYDIWFYISHIILHNKSLYKIIHKEHHNIDYKKMVFMDAYTGHLLESMFQGIGILFPLLFIQFNMYTFLFSLLLINIRGMLRHDNRFVWLIGNHHLLHHQYPQYNFGEYWLDKICKTNYPNINEYKRGIISIRCIYYLILVYNVFSCI
jgi:lathosterol oxidase